MNDPIGIFDSGIGGLTILSELQDLLQEENYIYYADSKNCPYGEKTYEELLHICISIIEFFIQKKCILLQRVV